MPLSRESLMITSHLERLTKNGWWTVGSQPAVDGVRSADPVVGWGPKLGHVFQKSFVEFFAGKDDVERIEKKVAEHGQGWVHYFAGDYQVSRRWSLFYLHSCSMPARGPKGECRSNVPDEGRNAVTWGVFPGQEIAQSTIIEKESFLSWKASARVPL
jgi:methylenetetrahydrofolate reductase (NADPH)